MKARSMIKLEHLLSPAFEYLSSKTKVKIYSAGRKKFLERFSEEEVEELITPEKILKELCGE